MDHWLALISQALVVAQPAWLVVDRQLLSDFAGSASFAIWLLAQTPQIYENYARGSVSGLSPFFLIQWMFGDLTNLIGAVLTHQLFFQVALASYFCSIDTVLLGQFWYYSRKESQNDADRLSITAEEEERLLEEQYQSPLMSPTHSRHDSASIRTTSTRSRWGYHSMRQGPATHERSASKGERSRSLSGPRRQRLTSGTTTTSSSGHSEFSSHDESYPQPHPHRYRQHSQNQQTTSLLASTSNVSATYRALSQAALSVAQIADEAAAVRRGRSRDTYHADGRSASRAPEDVRAARPSIGKRARSERNVGAAVSTRQPRNAGGLRAIFDGAWVQDGVEEGQGSGSTRDASASTQRRRPMAGASRTSRERSRGQEQNQNQKAASRRAGDDTESSGDDGGSGSQVGESKEALQRSIGSEAADRSGSASDSPADVEASRLRSDRHDTSKAQATLAQEAGLAANMASLRSDASTESSPSSTKSQFGYGFPSISVSDLTAAASSAPLESGATIRPWVTPQSLEETGRVQEGDSPILEEHRDENVRSAFTPRRTASRPSRPRTRTNFSHLAGSVGSMGNGRHGSPADASLSASQSLASLHSAAHPNSTRSPTAARAGAGMVLLSVGMLFALGQQVPGQRSAGRGGGRGSAGIIRWNGIADVGQTIPAVRSDLDWNKVVTGSSKRDASVSASPLRRGTGLSVLQTILGSRDDSSDAFASSKDGSLVGRSFGDDLIMRSDHEDDRRKDRHRADPKDPQRGSPHEPGPAPPTEAPKHPVKDRPKEKIDWEQLIGRSSAWTCTVLYLTSRLPQIWSNHMRKSVEGLSMLLFVAAFLGNLFYTISILANPKAGDWWTLVTGGGGGGAGATVIGAAVGMEKLTPEQNTYLRESLPFLIGSFGASFFDVTILSQWYTFRQ
ncbi:hypothetical protein CF326_g4260 [Tilletia indica]|nr:hypothetical protein CF326_g4260 [Tilletia indica]